MKKSKFLSRILACTLVLSVILSQMILSTSAISVTAADVPVWDGTTAESFAGGDGSVATPFLIETAEQLHKMVVEYSTTAESEGKYFKITNDIYLNDVADGTSIIDLYDKKNWLAGYGDTIATASKANSFNGTLDGAGYTIYGLYVNEVASAGLFPAISSGVTIKNLAFENILINGTGIYAGAIAGQLIYVNWQKANNITNCSVTNSTIGQWQYTQFVGGLIGDTQSCSVTFTNCYSYNLSLSDHAVPGGIIGTCYSDGTPKLINCYSIGNFPVRSNNKTTKCTNVYTDAAIPEGNTTAGVTVLTADQMKGEAAKENMAGFDFNITWKTVENGYPVIKNDIDFWDGTTATSYAGGTGTVEDPYIIENGAQLLKMVKESTAKTSDASTVKNTCFKIVNDICLNPVVAEDMVAPTVDSWNAKGYRIWDPGYRWLQSTGFCGTIDGDGHTIYGLYVESGCYSGFLANVVGNATVTNLHFKNAFVRGASNGCSPAIIIGAVNGNSTVRSTANVSYCTVDNGYVFSDHTGSWRNGIIVGGGFNEGKITVSNCAVTNSKGVITNTSTEKRTAAFIGNTNYTKTHLVENCYTDSSMHPVTDATTAANYDVIHDNKNYKNIYTSAAKPSFEEDGDITYLTDEKMKGEAAKTNMSALDYVCVWQTVENDYPILRKNLIPAWDGAAAESFAGGTGTAEDPFLIENGGQLYKMVAEYSNTSVSAIPESHTYFRITKDINLGGKQWYVTGKTSYPNNSNYTTGFSGIVDGGNHTIYSLYSKKSSATVGLIPVATQGAEIHNLHLESGNLPKAAWNTYAVGGLIGLAVGTKGSAPIVIEECSVKDYTIASRDASAAFVGYTHSQSVTIKDCFALGNDLSNTGTAAGDNSGAFIGTADGNDENNKITIETSYCADEAALIGFKINTAGITTFKDVYTANEAYDNSVAGLTKLTKAQMQGSAAIDNLNGFNFNQIWQNGADGEYPTYKSDEYKAMYWNGIAAESFAAGEGTAQKPYEISDANELYLLANLDTDATVGKYYKLTNDIAVSNVYEGWENQSPFVWASKNVHLDGFAYKDSFAGTLDGAGYTVSGLYFEDEITDNGTYAYGLIPYVTADAVIKNLNVENVSANVSGNAYVGGVAGAAHVAAEDIVNKLKMVQFVGVNVADCDITATNAGDILGGATRGVKFELCNAENVIGSYTENVSIRNCNSEEFEYNDDVLIYNSLNADGTTLVNITKYLLNTTSNYITDINGDSVFNIKDLVSAKKALVADEAEERMVWSQEFDGDSLDYTVWNENTTMSKGTTLEYANNTSFNGDTMTLSCNDTGNVDANGDKIYNVNYGLDTIDSMSFRYGRLEMRAKLPFAAGAFPSFWLTSRNAIGYESKCEYSTEIDIFEVFAKAGSSSKLTTCIHKWYNDENGVKTGEECSCGTGILAGNTYKVEEGDRSYTIEENAQNDFHTFVFEWDENSMKFSVDGNVYYTVDRTAVEKLHFDLSGKDTDIAGIFEQFVCIRLNNHMFTTGEGSAYAYSGDANDIDASKLNYEIDYIRLYQKNDGKSAINFR